MGLSQSDIIKFVILLIVIGLVIGLSLGVFIGCGGTTYTSVSWSDILGEEETKQESDTEEAEKESDDDG